MQKPRRRCLAAIGAAQRSFQQSHLQLADFVIEAHAAFGQQNRFMRGYALRQQLLRQMLEPDGWTRNRDHQPLYEVFQLAHIAQPPMLFQRR